MEDSTKEKNETKTRRTSLYNNDGSRHTPIIRFENVTKTYQNGVEAIKNLSFSIDDGEFVFLMGSSGAGKSTLIKLILLEEYQTEGAIYVDGKNLNGIRRSRIQRYRRGIGVFFQDFRLLDKKNVYQNVAFAMEITGASRKEINERVDITLSLMGLSAKKKEYPSHLSGGEQQRVALARAIVNGPKILIADEPTGNLDPENSGEIMDLLMKINSLGTTVLVATHEQDMAIKSGKRIIRLDHGRSISGEAGTGAETPESSSGKTDSRRTYKQQNSEPEEKTGDNKGGSENVTEEKPQRVEIPIESVSVRGSTNEHASKTAEENENA